DSMNLYEYVMSNPTNWVDPYGLKSLYKDQWSWWDRFRFENGMVGGWFGLSHEQTRRMDNYWLQYQRAQMLNQHPNEAKEYCKAAKSIASGCAKKAVMGYCEYIVFVDENGYGAVREKIIGYVAEPYTNRILMCYEYNGQDIDQAIADACNWQMVGADLVGLTDMSYGVDYLQGKESIDTTTGRTFRGQEQYVRGFQGTSQFCGTVAACAEGVMSCGTAVAGARAAPVETATGETYSVAYQTKLNPADFGGSRAVHFNRANASLDAALRSDPAFAAQMDQLIPGVGNSVSSVGGRATPSSWIWHHSTESGVMQLVPKVQHTPGSIFWDTMHPGGPGGYSIWAIPAGAPKN
ncbi:MAG TPA: HNH endonuclease, partial [Anaerohalosphaeraceae bacterium]|nr:HNH endonuclease [Anaerohalosphaeraceae bacterium]